MAHAKTVLAVRSHIKYDSCSVALLSYRQLLRSRRAPFRIPQSLHPGVRTTEASTVRSSGKQEFWVEIGILGPPHGIRGEVKVRPLTDFPEERFGVPGTRWLQSPTPKIGRKAAAEPVEVLLEFGRSTTYKGYDVWIIKLEGVDTPEDAALIKGHSLLIPADKRAQLEDEDEFYVQDLVGLSVYMQQSRQLIGKVVDLFDGTGSHDVLRIQLTHPSGSGECDAQESTNQGAKFVLLPFVKQLVPEVDLTNKRMEILPPEGLFDLASSPAKKRTRLENRGKRERRQGSRKNSKAKSDAGSGQVPVVTEEIMSGTE